MLRLIVIFSILINVFFVARASHIVGGDIYYDYLGNNNYRVYVTLYRDCNSTGAPFDNPLSLGIYRTMSNTLFQEVPINFPGSNVLPVVFNNPCVVPPNNICTERSTYVTIVNLPPIPGGYTLVYQRCCRGPNINNLINPDDTGLTLTTTVPGTESFPANSSARFNNYPPLLLCNNDDLIFDHSATDPDGDQLVYALATPYAGATPNAPAPAPPPPPPYPFVIWSGGNTQNSPLGPGSSISINPSTGLLTASPNLVGRYVVGIRVTEYRNGQPINTTVRDFIFQVFNCQITMEAILPTQDQLPGFVSYCQGLNVQFDNQSYGGTNYYWNFGVPGTAADTSNLFEPNFTYPDTGVYQAMLVVNPNWPCTDTAYIDITLYNEYSMSFTVQDSVCLQGNSLDFFGSSTAPPSVVYSWDFGSTGTPNLDTGQIIQNVNFASPGWHVVTLDGIFNECHRNFSDSVYIIPEPIADFTMPLNYQCEGLTVNFINQTQFATNYAWSFGYNNQTSTDFQPSFTYPSGNSYTVQLIVSSDPLCRDTMEQLVTVEEELVVDFSYTGDFCLTTNAFDFFGSVSGPPSATYNWTFPNSNIGTSGQLNVFDVNFTTPGTIPVYLTGQSTYCTEIDTQYIYIYSPPTIAFGIEPGLLCAPFEANFVNLSTSETPFTSFWNFGDGPATSTDLNPVHVYNNPGVYSPTLTIATDEGCIDTLTLTLTDYIQVHPTPVADFRTDKLVYELCEDVTQFINLSQGATIYKFDFDDNAAFSNDANPQYQYTQAGTYYPTLLALNDAGCYDSKRISLVVNPWEIYIPNTFTPDDENPANPLFFAASYKEPLEWQMFIYNRWGEEVFFTRDFYAT